MRMDEKVGETVKLGDIIKHERSVGTHFIVSKVFTARNHVKLKGFWIITGFVESWMLESDKIEIMKSDLNNWSRCVTTYDGFSRYSKWEKL